MTMPTSPPTGTDLPSRLLTIKDASEVLRVSTKTVRRWIDTGDLIAHRIGRQWRISRGDLETFIRMRRQG